MSKDCKNFLNFLKEYCKKYYKYKPMELDYNFVKWYEEQISRHSSSKSE